MALDMSTRYLGMTLRSPVVASAGPVTGDPDRWAALEAAGAGAIVLPSLFEEEIELEEFAVSFAYEQGVDVYGEAQSYLPEYEDYGLGPERFLSLVERAKDAVSIPVIASLNGYTGGGWVHYAKYLAEAGADALELNIYDVVDDPLLPGSEVEKRYVDLVEEVRAEVSIPLAVKIGPWFSSVAHFAKALEGVGADGLVLFNRFYHPDIDLETLEVKPHLVLSGSWETKLRLAWIGILNGQVSCSLAATGGVHDGNDVLKLLLAGADVVMTTSALLRHGPEHVASLLGHVQAWMEEREYESVEQLKGSVSKRNVPDPGVYQRANYYQVLHSWAPSPTGSRG
jgi:dihydroorotate dehydrogenase (fumarate)